MEFTNTFTIPVGPDDAFATLTDLETVAPCMPGAKLETAEGDVYTGKVKVKVGPMSLTYRGTAEVVDKDPDSRTARIEARGNEARGGGTANADVSASLVEVEDGTQVTVVTALDITGKPAQFGRGVMGDVGKRIIDSFAECLSRTLDPSQRADEDETTGTADTDQGADTTAAGATGNGDTPVDAPSAATPAQAAAATQQAATQQAAGPAASSIADARSAATGPRAVADREPEVEALDLMEVAGGSVARRALPVVGVAAVVAVVAWLFRRRGDDR